MRIKKLNPIRQYKEIADYYHEEVPKYYCKTCTRTTRFGKESLKYGEITYQIINHKCIYCNKELSTI